VVQVKAMRPMVYIYCQNPGLHNLDAFQPLLEFGGKISPTENVGREGHAYLEYIIDNYDNLPTHILFSQGMVHKEKEMFARLQVTLSTL